MHYLPLPVLGLHCRAGFPVVAAVGATLQLQCVGYSLRKLLLSQRTGSRVLGLSSCNS